MPCALISARVSHRYKPALRHRAVKCWLPSAKQLDLFPRPAGRAGAARQPDLMALPFFCWRSLSARVPIDLPAVTIRAVRASEQYCIATDWMPHPDSAADRGSAPAPAAADGIMPHEILWLISARHRRRDYCAPSKRPDARTTRGLRPSGAKTQAGALHRFSWIN